MNYSEKLKDPRWQRKRLEILQRDDFTCQCCGSKDKTLHVHHKYYLKVEFPWEYPDTALVTLCDDCHLLEGELSVMKQAFVQAWCDAGLLNVDMEGLSSAVKEISIPRVQLTTILSALSDKDFADKVIETYRVHVMNLPEPTDDIEF